MKKLIVIVSCLFVPFIACAQQSYNEYLNLANKAFMNSEYEKALELLEQAEKIASNEQEKASVNNAIGWTHYSDGNNERARKHLLEALRLAKEADDANLAQKISNNLGLLSYSESNLEEAKQYFSNKWSKDSDTSITYLSNIRKQQDHKKVNSIIASGVTCRLKKDFKGAIAEYDKALAIWPDNVRALEYKGYALYRLGNYIDAIEILEMARKVEPGRLNTIINLLKAHCATGSPDAANNVIKENSDLLKSKREVWRSDRELRRACKDIQLVEP